MGMPAKIAPLTEKAIARLLPWALLICVLAGGWATQAAKVASLDSEVTAIEIRMTHAQERHELRLSKLEEQLSKYLIQMAAIETDLKYLRLQMDEVVRRTSVGD